MDRFKKPHRPVPTLLAAAIVAAVLGGCGGDAPEARRGQAETASPGEGVESSGAVFIDEAEASGLDFVHWNGMIGELYLAEITCSGGALFDADGDGDLDAYLLQGRMLAAGKTNDDALIPLHHPPPVVDRLYRNELAETGKLSFTDVTATMGAEAPGYGCGVATGDFDNDGATDLYVLNLGPNQLLRNRGDGTFEDVTELAGVGDSGPGSTATFVDLDGDGWLDLFVGNYSDYFPENEPGCLSLSGAPDYCGPSAYPSRGDRLYRNRGDGTFEDVTEVSGLGSAPLRPALGVVAGDFNGDGRGDLYVANDGEANHLWLNQGPGEGGWVSFYDDAMLAGCALNGHGEAEASMGVDAGDVDNDGDLDIILAHLLKQTNTLYKNDGRGLFTDATASAGIGPPSLPFTSFGTAFFDYDNDGWLDLIFASGGVVLIPELVAAGDPFPLHQRNQLFRNLGGGTFVETTAEAGPVFELSEVSRTVALGDVDDDGDTDVLLVNVAAPARLLVNQVGQTRPWLGLRLVTGDPPRDALGARVALLRGGKPVMWRSVKTDGSYAAASDPRVLFGLGEDPRLDAVRVVWPDGAQEEFSDLVPGRYQTLREGEGSR